MIPPPSRPIATLRKVMTRVDEDLKSEISDSSFIPYPLLAFLDNPNQAADALRRNHQRSALPNRIVQVVVKLNSHRRCVSRRGPRFGLPVQLFTVVGAPGWRRALDGTRRH